MALFFGRMKMEQYFIDWNNLKYELITIKSPPPNFNERDIWWCSIGVNVGYEVNGKNGPFERPVLIIKKYNNDMFFGLPLTCLLYTSPSPRDRG